MVCPPAAHHNDQRNCRHFSNVVDVFADASTYNVVFPLFAK